MEILVHVSAPSSARDDARYRAQVAAIVCAFEPVSRQSLISDDDDHHRGHDGVGLAAARPLVPPPPPADAPEAAENAEPAEPADSSLLLQVPELISAPSSVSVLSLSAEDASTAIAGQPDGARQPTTGSDSRCDRDLKDQDQDQRRKNPLGNPPSPRAEGCLGSDPAVNATATATTIPNSNPNPNPQHDLQSILPSPSPGTNQIRPSPLVRVPAPIRESECQITGLNTQPQLAPDSLESLISVIPDSQPELAIYAQQSCQSGTRSMHEEDDQQSRSPKRRRVGPCSPPRPQTGRTISKVAALESTITLDSAHHAEKALSRPRDADEGAGAAALMQGLRTHTQRHPNNSPFPSHTSNPVSADPVLSVTEICHHQHQDQHQPPSDRDDLSLHHYHHDTILSTLPLSLQPPPPPISTSTFTTHITPTLAMLTQRLKPARTYKPTHQSRELDKLERGYWVMHINITPTGPGPELAQEQVQGQEPEKPTTKDSAGSGSSPSQIWSSAEFTHFWTFLSGFIAKEARAGWGVWCIVDRVEDHSPNTRTNHIPVQLKVYAWGEVAMHIYLMLYLASERRVRGMGLRWVDSWEEVVIQMP